MANHKGFTKVKNLGLVTLVGLFLFFLEVFSKEIGTIDTGLENV